MEMSKRLTPEIIGAATSILQPYCPELSPTDLIEALKKHGNAKSSQADRLQAPLSYKEFAKLSGLSLPTVHRMAKRGEIPKVKIGLRSIRIPYLAVERLLNGNQEQGA